VFWSFRVMVGLGLLMIALGAWSLWLRRGARLYEQRLFLRCVTWMGPAGLVAVLAGWITTEVGRQPWVVYGVLRTADAVSKHGVTPLACRWRCSWCPICSCSGSASPTCCGWCARGRRPSTRRRARGRAGHGRTPARPLSVPEKDATTESRED
jgi:cytochrome d ubiquinol oxidase subunit I